MESQHGSVTLNEHPTNSKLFRFCEKKIDQWIEARAAATSAASEATFKVTFTEEEGKRIACETEIRCGTALWRGADLANDTQQAFMHSLKRLQPH